MKSSERNGGRIRFMALEEKGGLDHRKSAPSSVSQFPLA
jgi:hypothetical protein